MASEPKEDGLVGARPQVGYSACGRPLPFPGEVQRFRLMCEVPTTLHIRGTHAAKTPSGARTKLVMLADGARYGQDRRSGAGAPLSDPSRPLAGLEGV